MDMFRAASIAAAWFAEVTNWESIEERIRWIGNTFSEISTLSMPQNKKRNRYSVWWCEDLNILREKLMKARRIRMRSLKKGNQAKIAEAYIKYRVLL